MIGQANHRSGIRPSLLTLALLGLSVAACSDKDSGEAGNTAEWPDSEFVDVQPSGDVADGVADVLSDAPVAADVLADGNAMSDAPTVPDSSPGADSAAAPDVPDEPDTAQPWPDADPPPAGTACKNNEDCPQAGGKSQCALPWGVCVACLKHDHCATSTGFCADFTCKPLSCVAGATKCKDSFVQTCNAAGDAWEITTCPDDKPVCVNDQCRLCQPGDLLCEAPPAAGGPSKAVVKCAADGDSVQTEQTCLGNQVCMGAKCTFCVGGSKRCTGGVAEVCADDGKSWQAVSDCTAKSQVCLLGLCVNPCAGDYKSNTNVGCDYWAVDLDNGGYKVSAEASEAAKFAVIISNTATTMATVQVTLGPDKNAAGAKTAVLQIPPGALTAIELPMKSWGIPPQRQEGSDVNGRVYRIESDQAIVAYQFNPAQNVGVYSNDASLLLPSHALGKDYVVMATPGFSPSFGSTFTVVATSPGDTLVTFTPTVSTLNGDTLPGFTKGKQQTIKLKYGQVLNVEGGLYGLPYGAMGGDLTGTPISADKAVAVFAGSEGSFAPKVGNCIAVGNSKYCAGGNKTCKTDGDCGPSCCADHIEEQLFPIHTWGKVYVAGRFRPRGIEKDWWRIVASKPGTTLKLTPLPVAGMVPPVLGPGQIFEFTSDQDFVIEANQPISVGQVMASAYETVAKKPGACQTSNECKTKYGFDGSCSKGPKGNGPLNCAPIGDPALMMTVATDQYLDHYVFLVPDKYAANYVTIVAPVGATVQLDGQALAAADFKAVAGSNWLVARLAVLHGVHKLKADVPVGLSVYGYHEYVSYAYAGGVKL